MQFIKSKVSKQKWAKPFNLMGLEEMGKWIGVFFTHIRSSSFFGCIIMTQTNRWMTRDIFGFYG